MSGGDTMLVFLCIAFPGWETQFASSSLIFLTLLQKAVSLTKYLKHPPFRNNIWYDFSLKEDKTFCVTKARRLARRQRTVLFVSEALCNILWSS